ncbi:MAG: class I SAM-dependent methyltransferase [Nitrospirae bacterium]|nr:class I SAM-dependent methyltransferase [Nitrospirota bacterium]
MSEEIDRFNKNYYRDKFQQFGDAPTGVDWKDRESQFYGFQYIIDTIRFYYPALSPFSIFEVGCGYGAFFEFLKERKIDKGIEYFGIDFVAEMVEKAKSIYPEIKDNLYVGDFKSFQSESRYDFITGSGIFNVKEHIPQDVYEAGILETVTIMFQRSEKGTVFNLMTPAPDYKDSRLYYPSLDLFFDFIYKKLSRKVVVVSSYPLWKITIGIFK